MKTLSYSLLAESAGCLLALAALFTSCSKETPAPLPEPDPVRIGDYYFEDGTTGSDLSEGKNAVGIVFYVNDDGKHGKVLSLTETYCIWGPVKTVTGATDPEEGLLNQRTIESLEEWQENYPGFAWCASLTDGNLEWYMPAKVEMRQIFAGMCGLRWVESGADESAGEINDWADDLRLFDQGEYSEERDTFNQRISQVGGTPVDLIDYGNWSSTEFDKDIAWYHYFANGYTHRSGKITGYFNKTRAVAVF